MTARTSAPRLLALGFGFIGFVMLAITGATGVQSYQDHRIGTLLVETGEQTQALIVTVQRLERNQCSRSQRAICVGAQNIIATIVYQVPSLRAASELNLTLREVIDFEDGEDVLIDLMYLPSAPQYVERTSGDRLATARGSTTAIYVQAAFGITFLVIGALTGRASRKRGPAA